MPNGVKIIYHVVNEIFDVVISFSVGQKNSHLFSDSKTLCSFVKKMMGKQIPPYYISKKNTIIQIAFTTLFAYIFINLYQPFSAIDWYDVSWWVFSLASGILVISGMLVVLLSRLFMFWIKHIRPITILYYMAMVAGEIVFMALLYVLLERWVLRDMRPFFKLLYFSIQNTALILLIPYLISALFFEWQEKKISLEKLIKQISHKAHFISFKDEKGTIRITLKVNDVIFLESFDNYVYIHYLLNGKMNKYLIRNTLKQFVQDLTQFPLLRCHRSFMVNMNHVKMMKREKTKVQLIMDEYGLCVIPVSKSYSEHVFNILGATITIQDE